MNTNILKWILVFVAVAILAGALGATAIEYAMARILWVGFVVVVILAIISFVTGKKVV